MYLTDFQGIKAMFTVPSLHTLSCQILHLHIWHMSYSAQQYKRSNSYILLTFFTVMSRRIVSMNEVDTRLGAKQNLLLNSLIWSQGFVHYWPPSFVPLVYAFRSSLEPHWPLISLSAFSILYVGELGLLSMVPPANEAAWPFGESCASEEVCRGHAADCGGLAVRWRVCNLGVGRRLRSRCSDDYSDTCDSDGVTVSDCGRDDSCSAAFPGWSSLWPSMMPVFSGSMSRKPSENTVRGINTSLEVQSTFLYSIQPPRLGWPSLWALFTWYCHLRRRLCSGAVLSKLFLSSRVQSGSGSFSELFRSTKPDLRDSIRLGQWRGGLKYRLPVNIGYVLPCFLDLLKCKRLKSAIHSIFLPFGLLILRIDCTKTLIYCRRRMGGDFRGGQVCVTSEAKYWKALIFGKIAGIGGRSECSPGDEMGESSLQYDYRSHDKRKW